MKKIFSFFLSATLIFTMFGNSFPAYSAAAVDPKDTKTNSAQSDAAVADTTKKTDASATTNTTASDKTETDTVGFVAPPSVKSDAYAVVDLLTGQVLVSKNRDKKQYPADLSMIMTASLALEIIGASNMTSTSRTLVKEDLFSNGKSFESRWTPYDTGEEVKAESLLYGTLIAPADDAATALANLAAEKSKSGGNTSTKTPDASTDKGTENNQDLETGLTQTFVDMMNKKAKSMGLQNTAFATPRGSYNENQYTTAFDMAQIVRYALNVDGFTEYFKKNTYVLPATSKHNETRTIYRPSSAMMTQESAIYSEGTFGLKTGYNAQANSTGIAACTRNNRTLIAVVLNCPGQDSTNPQTDMANLFNYCFDNFTATTFTEKELLSTSLNIYDSRDIGHKIIGKATVNTGGDLTLMVYNRYSKKDVEINSNIPGHFFDGESKTATLSFTLKESAQPKDGVQYMDSSMGQLGMKVTSVLDSELKAQKEKERKELLDQVWKWSKIVLIVLGVLIIMLFAIRFYNIQKYKKIAARKRAAQRRREKLKK